MGLRGAMRPRKCLSGDSKISFSYYQASTPLVGGRKQSQKYNKSVALCIYVLRFEGY